VGKLKQGGGVPIWGSGEEEAYQSSVVHDDELQLAQLIGDGIARGRGGRRLGCGAGWGSGEA
jgi:hypothetical protein